MSSLRVFHAALIGAALASLICAQTQTSPVIRTALNPNELPRPPIPNDPLELVPAGAQQVQTVEQRYAATQLLTKARDLSNVRAQPYDLKTTFISSGRLPSDGSWTLEDISPGRGIYRWTAQGPNYAAVNLFTQASTGIVYSNQPGGGLPLRLMQVREAIFFNQAQIGPQVAMRTATANLGGSELHCVLLGVGVGLGIAFASLPSGRAWDETEYCVDAATGLLATYSPVPGLYIHYDYSNAVQFHGKTIAGSFTISQAGEAVIQAKTVGVSDPPDPKEAMFDSKGLTALGVGREMSAPFRSRSMGMTGVQSNPTLQVVVLHGTVLANGQLGEVEVLATTDPSLNQQALDRAANQGVVRTMIAAGQPGTTQQSHETIFLSEFVTSGH